MMGGTTYDLLRAAHAITDAFACIDFDDDEAIAEATERAEAWCEASGDKLAALRAVSLRLKSEADLLKAEAARLTARRRSCEVGRERVMCLATQLLEAVESQTGEGKVKTTEFTAYLASSESLAAPDDLEAWPERFRVSSWRPDRKAATAAIRAGDDLPGFSLVRRKSARFR